MNKEFIELLGLKVKIKNPNYPITKTGYLIEDSIYIDGNKYSKDKIDQKYIEVLPPLFQTLNDEHLRNIFTKMSNRIDELEDRLDNI